MQNFLVTRKSMGGISIDMSARALDGEGVPVPGLYAAGEVTGVAGINGSVGMSGTFLGPSVMIGRIAARTILDTLALNTDQPAMLQGDEVRAASEPADWTADMDADGLKKLLNEPRSGYWHFDVVHELVLERNYACTLCHSSNVPMKTAITKAELIAQSKICTTCHN
jgi:succinate dehydrogenase/fumarate reductase flavoprotein subunit